jgi:hypothetical protein
MNPPVKDFPALIRWIADHHHDGAVYPMHARLGVSPALVQLWVTGGVKTPTLDYLERLCIAYSLDFAFVRNLIRKRSRYAAPIGGGSAAGGTTPLANLAEILPLIGSWLARWVQPLHPEWRFA